MEAGDCDAAIPHFEQALSFPALAARLEQVYADVAAGRRGRPA